MRILNTGDIMETIEMLAGEVRLSIARTEADYDTACEAFRRGARQVRHARVGHRQRHHRPVDLPLQLRGRLHRGPWGY